MKPKNGIDELRIDRKFGIYGASGEDADYVEKWGTEVTVESPDDDNSDFALFPLRGPIHLKCKSDTAAKQIFSKVTGINLEKLPKFDRTRQCHCRKFLRKLLITVSDPGHGEWIACSKCGGRH